MSAGVCLLLFLLIFMGCAALLRVPVCYSLAISAFSMLVINSLPIVSTTSAMFSSIDNFPILAIAFFIYAGTLMEYSGIAEGLLIWVETFIGRVRGYVAMVTVIASGLFGMLSGSGMATLSAIGKPMIAEMKKRGYRASYAAAVAAASCFLGILIPPSAPGISYALIAGTKITEVWLATVAPGVLIIILYLIVIYWQRRKIEPKNTDEKLSFGPYMKLVGHNTRKATPAIIMPLIIFGGIYGGICTATEAGAISAIYGLCYFLVKKYYVKEEGLRKVNLYSLTIESIKMIAAIGLLQTFAYCCSRMIAQVGISSMIADFVLKYVGSKNLFLLIVNVMFLFMGMFLDLNPAILLMTPLLLNAAKALGIDPAHFGAISLVNLCYGNLTPPFACSCFVASGLADAPFQDVIKDSLPFMAVGIIVIIFTTYCPGIVMWLPKMLG